MAASKFTATLAWEAEPSGETETATWGELTIVLGDVLLWGSHEGSRTRGARWTWVDLLEHLAEVWPWLLFEEGWPEQGATKEDELFEHRFRHDLAMAIRGKALPPLWIVREGKHAWVGGETTRARLDFHEVEAVLASLGDQIAERLRPLDDERARETVHGWLSRSELAAPEHPAIAQKAKASPAVNDQAPATNPLPTSTSKLAGRTNRPTVSRHSARN
jgi:hypothetical protein